MFKNYLVISLRNLLKNNFYLLINVLGLALALSTCTVAYFNSEFALGYDKFHDNLDQIYKVHVKKSSDNGFTTFGINPFALGPNAAGDITAIERSVRVMNPRITVKKGDIVLSKEVGFVEQDFFDLFTFPLESGDAELLRDPKSIFLSKETAEVYFPDKNPVGELLTLISDEDREFAFSVAGILEKHPVNSTMNFDMITLYENYFTINNLDRNNSWEQFTSATFFQINSVEDARTVEKMLANYVDIQNKARDDWKVAKYELMPYEDFAGATQSIYANWLDDGMHPAAALGPPVMGLLMLLIACFNFTNTSLAMANKRLKEIGIRKTMGGSKMQLVFQFMGENLLICMLAVAVSLVLSNYIVPEYGALWENMELSLNFRSGYSFYLFLILLLLLTSVIAGAYPSMYVSSFNPVQILRGTLKISGSSKFSQFLLGFQYVLTVMTLFCGFAFIQNAWFQEEADMGFNRDKLVGIKVDNSTDFAKMEPFFRSHPDIDGFADAHHHLGRWDYSRTLEHADQKIESMMIDIGVNYMDVMDMEIIAGRKFDPDLKKSDQENSMIVNEKLVKEFGWQDPIGKRVAVDDSTKLTVIGVVKDFHQYGFWQDVEPFGIRLVKDEKRFFLVAKAEPQKLKGIYHGLEKEWIAKVPTRSFQGFFQDQLGIIRMAKEVNGNIVTIFGFMSLLSVVLSGLGLFTLVSLNIMKRIKEIGIRKALGAPTIQILYMINKPFLIILTVGSSIGLIAGYYTTEMMIDSIFDYYKPFDLVTFLIPVFLVVTVSLVTSVGRILVAAFTNPVRSLRYE